MIQTDKIRIDTDVLFARRIMLGDALLVEVDETVPIDVTEISSVIETHGLSLA
jgi:hypothetical protein